ncbi:MAG: helix-turn-helix domain-containing protein [Syntrophobacteraceae bacterium]|jgi:predicted DNA-binding transcriptional regulator AlpA
MEQARPRLTVDELAQELRVPASWVYSQTRRKGNDTIPCLRVGPKYIRFDPVEVREWLRRRFGRRQD